MSDYPHLLKLRKFLADAYEEDVTDVRPSTDLEDLYSYEDEDEEFLNRLNSKFCTPNRLGLIDEDDLETYSTVGALYSFLAGHYGNRALQEGWARLPELPKVQSDTPQPSYHVECYRYPSAPAWAKSLRSRPRSHAPAVFFGGLTIISLLLDAPMIVTAGLLGAITTVLFLSMFTVPAFLWARHTRATAASKGYVVGFSTPEAQAIAASTKTLASSGLDTDSTDSATTRLLDAAKAVDTQMKEINRINDELTTMVVVNDGSKALTATLIRNRDTLSEQVDSIQESAATLTTELLGIAHYQRALTLSPGAATFTTPSLSPTQSLDEALQKARTLSEAYADLAPKEIA